MGIRDVRKAHEGGNAGEAGLGEGAGGLRMGKTDFAGEVRHGGLEFTTPGQRLDWRTELRVIVLACGKPGPRNGQLTDEQFAKWDQIWGMMQRDLATQSPKGQYRRAKNSGHLINLDEPELVVRAIGDVLSRGPR